ncbi:S41 family peptidase [Streptococcus plurextorum]|uniref:S41 family peptidase n=1 Tax=Streptococcus plurextorum TaxID=456876 RepID=UPI00041D6FEF|nr:S41 family peptidase [Streptococcus plurextorum]
MTKLDIFNQVVAIMLNDSSTKKDKLGTDPEPFRQQISEDMSDAEFIFVVNHYLASFGVLSHVCFYSPKLLKAKGFRLRTEKEKLYVIEANPETHLQVGDVIIALDNISVADFYEQHKGFFVSKTPERQYMDWAGFVSHTAVLTIERSGVRQEISYKQADALPTEAFAWSQLDEDTVYLKMENFSDESAISNLYQESGAAISRSKNLIIDVRVNHGGSDSLYWPLFNYALGQGQTMKEIPDDGFGQEFLYTERNVDLRLQRFAEELANPDVSAETRELLGVFSEELKKYRGMGYVTPVDSDEHDYFAEFIGQASPENVIVLSDVYCGSSGDNFVATMKKLPKVTVMGRPTMGILDYSNCCTASFDDYVLIFPTSRLLAIDHGIVQADKGIEPDIVIPWTPEHFVRDVDIAEALAFLKKKEEKG